MDDSSSSLLRRCSSGDSSPPPLQPPPHRIPGPAGVVQEAILRKASRSLREAEEDPVSTQEYIRRAIEDPRIDDEDFTRNPWNSAIHFVRTRQGFVVGSENPMPIGTPLTEIKGFHFCKVPQVVAIVKSCKKTEFGDLMVSLKDPTGTIDATVHRRVLSQEQYANDLSVGAAIILQNVAVFSPWSSIHYLNITLNNVVKVIPKESEPLPNDKYPAATLVEAHENSPKGFSLSQARTQGIMNNLRKPFSESERRDSTPMVSNIFGAVNDSMLNGRKCETEVGNVQVQVQCSRVSSKEEEDKDNGGVIKKYRQPIVGIPEWTDEQLDELFA